MSDNTAEKTKPDKGKRSLRRRLVWQFLGGVAALMAVLGISGKFLKEPIVNFSCRFVDALGGLGVALGFFVPDTFPLPVWHDGFLIAGYLGGLGFWEMAVWASAGSLLGGTLGFFLARKVSHTGWFSRFIEKRGKEAAGLVKQYGLVGLAITALSPIPYSVGVWTVGAFEVPYYKFLAVSMIRIPRILFYLQLVKIGVVSFF